MNLSDETVKKIKGLIVFAVIVVIIGVNWQLCLAALLSVASVFTPFILGGCLAFVANIPMRFIESKLGSVKRQGARRALGIVITFLLTVVILMAVLLLIIPQIAVSIRSLQRSIPGFLNSLSLELTRLIDTYPEILSSFESINIDWNSLVQTVSSWISRSMGSVIPGTVTAIAGIASVLTNGVIAFIFAIYILIGKEKLSGQAKSAFRAFLPEHSYRMVLSIARLISEKFSAFVTGQCLEACILGMMFIITLSVAGMPYATLIGVLVAVTALIPVFGAFIGCVVGAFLMLMQSPMLALAFIIIFLVIQQIEGNLIYPHVVGGKVDLPAIWVLVAVTSGGAFFGVVGMIVFIPIFSVLYALLRSYVHIKNGTPREEEIAFVESDFSAAVKDVSARLRLEEEEVSSDSREAFNKTKATDTVKSSADEENINNAEASDRELASKKDIKGSVKGNS